LTWREGGGVACMLTVMFFSVSHVFFILLFGALVMILIIYGAIMST